MYGTNELIKIGAKLVTTPNDILKEFGINSDVKEIIELEDKERNIDEKYLDVYKYITYNPENIQNIAKLSGLGIVETMQKVSMLELLGHIKNLPGNYYIRI